MNRDMPRQSESTLIRVRTECRISLSGPSAPTDIVAHDPTDIIWSDVFHPGFGTVDLARQIVRAEFTSIRIPCDQPESSMLVKPFLSAALAAVLLAGCGADAKTSAGNSTTGNFPMTLTNCGFAVTVDKPPRRVITIKSTSTELLLALGLGSKIIGSAFSDGPIPSEWADAAAKIPILFENAPSQEVVLAKEPDFIYAGWESNLAAETAGERGNLAKLGVGTYVSPAACKEPKFQPTKMSYDLLFNQIDEIGRIFDIRARADALIATQKLSLSTIRKVKPGTSALWYSSGTDLPYVGAGIGTPQMVMTALGLNNIAADVKDTWTSMSWETIVSDNPNVIILVDASWNSAAKKIALLKSNPTTSKLDAVRSSRFLVIPFSASEAGVRTVPATVELSKELSALGYDQ